MGKAKKSTFYAVYKRIDEFKAKLSWDYYEDITGRDGGALIVVFKRNNVKYTMRRTLGVAPTDHQTQYCGPWREDVLSSECLQSMLVRAIATFQAERCISRSIISETHLERLSQFCTPDKVVPTAQNLRVMDK